MSVTRDDLWPRAILHVDLDAFYASVEQLRRPELRGRPVIVGGGDDGHGNATLGRGVVSAASYEARVFGVHSAMPLATARRLCPQAHIVPVDFTAYRAASAAVFAIVRQVTPQVEPMSLDEAYLDVTASQVRFGSPPDIARGLRDEIREECSLDASFGVAATRTVAKIASDLRKPRGFVVVPPGEEAVFLSPLALRLLPGVGPATERAIAGLGVSTLGQLASMPIEVVVERVGEVAGRSLWQRAHGIDTSPVTVPDRPKSVSREETFQRDVDDRALCHERLRHLAADVGHRLRDGGWQGRTVTLKLRYWNFSTLTRQTSIESATDTDVVIADHARRLFDKVWTGARVRLLGVGVTGVDDALQLDLLQMSRDARIDRSLDTLRERFGPAAIARGSGSTLRDLDFRGEDLRTQRDAPASR